jgi:hypothetical protein
VVQVVGCLLRVARCPGRGWLGPRIAEPGKVVVGVEHDGGDAAERAFLDDPSDENGLARAGSGEDGSMLAQRLKVDCDVDPAVERDADR